MAATSLVDWVEFDFLVVGVPLPQNEDSNRPAGKAAPVGRRPQPFHLPAPRQAGEGHHAARLTKLPACLYLNQSEKR